MLFGLLGLEASPFRVSTAMTGSTTFLALSLSFSTSPERKRVVIPNLPASGSCEGQGPEKRRDSLLMVTSGRELVGRRA